MEIVEVIKLIDMAYDIGINAKLVCPQGYTVMHHRDICQEDGKVVFQHNVSIYKGSTKVHTVVNNDFIFDLVIDKLDKLCGK